MFRNCGFNAEKSNGTSKLTGLLKKSFILKALAEESSEGDTHTSPEGDTHTLSFEELIAKARKEEKDKLYGRITKLEGEKNTLTQANNDKLLRIAELEEENKTLKNKGDSEEVTSLKAQLTQTQEEFETFKKSTPKEDDIRAQIEAEYEVKNYRAEKLREGANELLSVFTDEVTGTTKEEIDASYAKALEKTIATKKQLGLVDDEGKPIDSSKKKKKKETTPSTPNTKETTPPPANPPEEDEKEYDLDYVRNLDPSSPEYAEFRKSMGLK